jgi:hypothetical protein
MKKALLDKEVIDGKRRIIQIEDVEFPVHPDFEWVDVNPTAKVNDSWDGSNVIPFVPEPEPPEDILGMQLSAATRAIIEELVDDPAYNSLPDVAAYRANPDRPSRP